MSQSSLENNQVQPAAHRPNQFMRRSLMRPLRIFAEVIFLFALSAYIVGGAQVVPFHADESSILYTTRDLYSLLHNQMDQLLYSATPEQVGPRATHDQELRLLNGSVARYVYGYFSMNKATFEPFEPINEDWDWGGDWAYNLEMGHKPADLPLNRARLVSSLVLIGALFALYGLARRIGGPGAAVVAALYFTFNPAVLINGRRAFQESFWLFFGLLSLYMAVDLCVRIRGIWGSVRQRAGFLPVPILSYFFLGGTLGLTLASKHTGLFYVAAVLGAVTLAPLWAQRRMWLKHLSGLSLMVGTMIGVFFAMNPAWWSDPIASLNEVLRLRAELLTGQISWYGGYANTAERLIGLIRQSFVAQPQYYEVVLWKDYIPDQIAAYEVSGWQGASIGGLIAGFIVVGLIACVRSLFAREPLASEAAQSDEQNTPVQADPDAASVWPSKMGSWVALWLGIAGLAAAIATPLEWQRYYLPLYPAIAVFAGVGVMEIVRVVTKQVSEYRTKRTAVVSA